MADDEDEVKEFREFHPCDAPRGMNYYNLKDLTADQQQQLNLYKCDIVRDNQKYLYEHPEIRAFISIIMRKILRDRPSHDIQLFIAKYCTDNWADIEKEMDIYIESRKKEVMIKSPEVSSSEETEESSESEPLIHITPEFFSVRVEHEPYEETESEREIICREILLDILKNVGEFESRRVSTETIDLFDLNKFSISLPDDDFLDFDLDTTVDVGGMFDQFEDIE